MKTEIYNKSGELSNYGLICGYVEKQETDKEVKQMYIEHAHIHVRSGPINEYLPVWEVFEATELTKARKFYKSIKLK